MVKLYNSRGLLDPPEASVAIGRAGAEMGGIKIACRKERCTAPNDQCNNNHEHEHVSNIGPTCPRIRAIVFWLDTVAGC